MRIYLSRRSMSSNSSDIPLKQAGQSAVEIALMLPLLLLLLFGIIIVAFNFFALIQVSNAAREGARAGSLYRITNATTGWALDQTVQKAIYDPVSGKSALGYLSTSSPSFNVGSDVVCTLNGASCSAFTQSSPPHAGDQLIVRVNYRYTTPIVSQALPMFPQPLPIVRTVVMEVQ